MWPHDHTITWCLLFQCKSSCAGDQSQHRNVSCVVTPVSGGVEVKLPDEACIEDGAKPDHIQECTQWMRSEWGACHVGCGPRKLQMRSVVCATCRGAAKEEESCHEVKPTESRWCEEVTCGRSHDTQLYRIVVSHDQQFNPLRGLCFGGLEHNTDHPRGSEVNKGRLTLFSSFPPSQHHLPPLPPAWIVVTGARTWSNSVPTAITDKSAVRLAGGKGRQLLLCPSLSNHDVTVLFKRHYLHFL